MEKRQTKFDPSSFKDILSEAVHEFGPVEPTFQFNDPNECISKNKKLTDCVIDARLPLSLTLNNFLNWDDQKMTDFMKKCFPGDEQIKLKIQAGLVAMMMSNYDVKNEKTAIMLSEYLGLEQYGIENPNNVLFSNYQNTYPGISGAQLYLKYRCPRTALHQETLCFRSINVNCGQDSSEWFYIKIQDNEIFEEFLKKEKIDPIADELIYWIDIIKNYNIDIQKVVQKSGEVVITEPKLYHWVKCSGKSIHFSYNFCDLEDKNQIQCSAQRYEKVIKCYEKKPQLIKKSLPVSTFPFKNMLLNNTLQDNNKTYKKTVLAYLKNWLQKEKSYLSYYKQVKDSIISWEVHFCDVCGEEILVYFVSENNDYILCSKCGKNQKSIYEKKTKVFLEVLLNYSSSKMDEEINVQQAQNQMSSEEEEVDSSQIEVYQKEDSFEQMKNIYPSLNPQEKQYLSYIQKFNGDRDFQKFTLPPWDQGIVESQYKNRQSCSKLKPSLYFAAKMNGATVLGLSKVFGLCKKTIKKYLQGFQIDNLRNGKLEMDDLINIRKKIKEAADPQQMENKLRIKLKTVEKRIEKGSIVVDNLERIDFSSTLKQESQDQKKEKRKKKKNQKESSGESLEKPLKTKRITKMK